MPNGRPDAEGEHVAGHRRGQTVTDAEALLVIQEELSHAFENVRALVRAQQARIRTLQEQLAEVEARAEQTEAQMRSAEPLGI